MKSIVEQIHEEFYTASNKIVESVIPTKAKVLYNLGFTSSSEAKAFDPELTKLKEFVLHYRMRYPNNKFITDDEVQKICRKYKLICGPVSAYKGTVPDDKLVQIARFKLNKEDVRPDEFEYRINYLFDHNGLPRTIKAFKRLGDRDDISDYIEENLRPINSFYIKSATEIHTNHEGLFICAPEKEMGIEGLTKKGVFAFLIKERVIEDPVVLKPCKGGFLIVAAWGPEASDEDVVNHKMN